MSSQSGDVRRSEIPGLVAGRDGVGQSAAQCGHRVGVYDMTGQLSAGGGPAAADQVTRTAAKGVVVDGQIGSDLLVAVPVSSAEEVVGVARASVPASLVWRDFILA